MSTDPSLHTVPQTFLEAVNTILAAAGVTDIMSLDAPDLNEDASDSIKFMNDAARIILADTWHVNEVVEFQVVPDAVTKECLFPGNFVNVTMSPRSYGGDEFIERGRKLFNKTKRTYQFDAPVYIDARELMSFEELPQAWRWYITAMAGRMFGSSKRPNDNTYKFSSTVELGAKAAAIDFDNDSRGQTLQQTNPHFQYRGRTRGRTR